MWVFFTLVSISIVAVVSWLLYRFPNKNVPVSVLGVMAASWLISISIIAFIPLDVYATIKGRDVHAIYVMWQISFWSTQFLTWLGIPLFMGYVDSGAFDNIGRIKSSIWDNLAFYSILVALSFIGKDPVDYTPTEFDTGIIIVMAAGNLSVKAIPGTCIALANMFGLTVVVFLLGYGLVSLPRSSWRLSNPEAQLKRAHYNIGRLSSKLEDSIKEMKRVNLVVHASQQQISRRDQLRQYVDMIEQELMSSKPAGIELEQGQALKDHIKLLTAEELDYALDMDGLIGLRRRPAARTEYTSAVKHAMFVAEICKRRQNRDYSRGEGSLENIKWYSICVLSPIGGRLAAVAFGLMSVVIVWSELVIVGHRTYLSPTHLLLDAAHNEWAVYTVILIPLCYMFYCTYHTLFNLAGFRFYHLLPKATSAYSLLLNGTLMCRFTAPLAYNFLHVIQIIQKEDDRSTAFSKVMGVMKVLPFLGTQFNSILPILLLIHCLLIWFDVWNKVAQQFIPARYQFIEEDADDDHSTMGRRLLGREEEARDQGRPIGEILGVGVASDAAPRSSTDQSLKEAEEADRSKLDSIFSSATDRHSQTKLLLDQDGESSATSNPGWKFFSRK